MSEPDDNRIAIESYGGGFIIADYNGRRWEAAYRGIAPRWRRQPVINDPFPTQEEAAKAAEELAK